MRPRTRRPGVIFLFALVAPTLALDEAVAQKTPIPASPGPRLLYVVPAGGQAGTTLEVTVTGQDLTEPQGLYFSQPGITAEPLGMGTPPAPDPKAAMKKAPKGKQPAKTASQRFKVTIPADTPPGIHDVRFVNKQGVSNPRAFVVGDLKEAVEKEPNNDVDQAQRVPLNGTVHGVIGAPTDVDYFVFAGRKGQRVVVSCLTSSIDSRLQATLELYTSAGRQLVANRHYQGGDALLDATLPDDGDYQVRVASFAYVQGGPDHFYRLTIATAPWIDAVFPPVVEPGKRAELTVYGRNLPGGKPDPAAVADGRVLEKLSVTVDVPGDALATQRLAYHGLVTPPRADLDGFEYRLRNDVGTSNPFLLNYARAPVVCDQGGNDTRATAQAISLPCEIAGTIEKKGDRDWYTFSAKKGDVYSIEAYGERLGSPLDLYYTLTDAKDKFLAGSDETPGPAKLGPMDLHFFTRTDDPARHGFVVPADGTYYLQVGSREAMVSAGPRHLYRVRITPEQPDFHLVAMPLSTVSPDAVVLGREGHAAFGIQVLRQDGFNGEVTLTGADLPPGVSIPPQTVPPGQRQAVLVVSASDEAEPWTGPIRVLGTATISGKKVLREVRSATITWAVPQPNIPTITRLDRDLVLAVRERPPFTLTAGVPEVTITPGQPITVPLKLQRFAADFKTPVQVVGLNLPAGLTLQPLSLASGKDEVKATLTTTGKLTPGTYTVVFRGQTGQIPKKLPGNQIVPLGITQVSTPVALTVAPKEVAKLTVTPANVTVKAGREAAVTVKVARQFDYDGELKIRLVLPPDAKGLSAEEVVIPAGKNEARLVVAADADAKAGPRQNVRVQATALFNGKVPTTQESKLGVNVAR
jgi:hypothetical protein